MFEPLLDGICVIVSSSEHFFISSAIWTSSREFESELTLPFVLIKASGKIGTLPECTAWIMRLIRNLGCSLFERLFCCQQSANVVSGKASTYFGQDFDHVLFFKQF